MPDLVNTEAKNDSERDAVARLSHTLDVWRGRVDELLVQFDLAGLDARDEVRKRIDITENAYLAARSRMSVVRRDAKSNADSLCQGTEKLIRDLEQVYEAAQAALHHGTGK